MSNSKYNMTINSNFDFSFYISTKHFPNVSITLLSMLKRHNYSERCGNLLVCYFEIESSAWPCMWFIPLTPRHIPWCTAWRG